ncbi:unnamed protein product [Ceutorhynchus assimilis]|uniref:Cell cycle checkpoint protein RAD17 n=1 Tax=Ceutorhynchus assimilis TaxID=467358 RepID=A0A9N9MU74_9CUCU|nr:unnamed protein product [Ceutorhynchus assimilis]
MKKLTTNKWKSFEFGPPEKDTKENQSTTRKLKNLQPKKSLKSVKGSKTNNNLDFHKIIEPKVVSDLIIHPKKVQELEGWLNTVLGGSKKETHKKIRDEYQDRVKKGESVALKYRNGFPIIEIKAQTTGPTGSGKTSTVRLLCKQLNVDVTEWTNPVDLDYEIIRGPGQAAKFLEFFSDSKYPSLFSTNKKKVLIVKDFPNAIVRNPDEFFSILEDVHFQTTHPVIFICTDSNSNETNLQRNLFPEEVLLKYSISNITFNSCAPTLLKKGLKRALELLQAYPDTFTLPLNIIESIIASSMGDIRCAMNQLYLASIHAETNLPLIKIIGSKRKKNDQPNTIKHMRRDETLGLFHGLGRVLNPKKIEQNGTWRLNCDMQKLVDEFTIQPAKFASFLFENYLKYFGDLEDIEQAAEILSFSHKLLENWDSGETLTIALWIAVLGLMVCNQHKVSRWNQIKGPKKIEKEVCDNDVFRLHPSDRYYYNLITKSDKYHKFKCGT